MCIYVYVFLTAQVPGFLGLRLQARLPFLRCSSGLALLQTNFDSYQVKKDSLCKPWRVFPVAAATAEIRNAAQFDIEKNCEQSAVLSVQQNDFLEVMSPARWQSLQLLLASVWIVAIVCYCYSTCGALGSET